MKLTWITSRFPPDKGGMSASAGRIVQTLRRRGHSVTVVKVPEQRDAVPANEEADAAADGTGSLLLSQGDYERIFFSFRRNLEGSSLVGFGGTTPAYLAVLWAKWLGTRSTVLFRGNDFDRVVHDPRRAWIVHQVLSMADTVGAVATEMVHRIAALRTGPTVFTPNSIDPEEWTVFERDREIARQWRETNAAGRPVVGLFGQLKYKKGLDLVMDLFDYPGLRSRPCLLTVGDLPPTAAEALRDRCGDAWVHAPYQQREDLPGYYLACDAVLIPSHYDGMPNVLLEAMLAGVPVVASRAGGIPDVIEDQADGFLFPTADLAGAAAALDRCLALAPEARQNLIAAARTKIEQRFTPAREAEILERAFRGPEKD